MLAPRILLRWSISTQEDEILKVFDLKVMHTFIEHAHFTKKN